MKRLRCQRSKLERVLPQQRASSQLGEGLKRMPHTAKHSAKQSQRIVTRPSRQRNASAKLEREPTRKEKAWRGTANCWYRKKSSVGDEQRGGGPRCHQAKTM